MSEFVQLKTNFPIPMLLQHAIDELQVGIENRVSYIDCLQDEVRSCARELDDEEQEKIIINYYVNRRW